MVDLLLLPFVDQHVHAQLLAPEQIEIVRETIVFGDDILAHGQEIGEVARERIGLAAHVRKHGAERNRGAHRLQRVFGPNQQRRRRLAPDALEGGKDFNDRGTAFVERLANGAFLVVERLEPRTRRLDGCLDVAHACGGVDELLVERAAIVANALDLAPKLRLAFRRRALLRPNSVEFLIVLLERVGIALRRCNRHGRRRRSRRRCNRHGRWRRNRRRLPRARRYLTGRGLRECGHIARQTAAQKPVPSRAQGADQCGSAV